MLWCFAGFFLIKLQYALFEIWNRNLTRKGYLYIQLFSESGPSLEERFEILAGHGSISTYCEKGPIGITVYPIATGSSTAEIGCKGTSFGSIRSYDSVEFLISVVAEILGGIHLVIIGSDALFSLTMISCLAGHITFSLSI